MTDLLDLELVQQLDSFELRARYLVEGYLSGLNRSPFKGFSSEFSQYRVYRPGDPLKLIDWKLYGRTDRLYVKEFTEETNLQCHLVIDLSGSMAYRSREAYLTKQDYACTCAASLAWFLQKQRDAVGLTLLLESGLRYLPARLGASDWRRMLANLDQARAEGTVGLFAEIEKFANLLRRRSLLVLISDFYQEVDEWASVFRRLRHDHHEVIGIQVMDPAEIEFTFQDSAFFQDLEDGSRLAIDPELLRKEYLSRFQSHQSAVQKLCRNYQVDFTMLRTDESPLRTLSAYLAKREAFP